MPDHPEQSPEEQRKQAELRGGDIDRPRLKRRLRLVLIVLVALALILAVWGIVSRLMDRSQVGRQTATDAALTVITTKPDASAAPDELVLPGTVTGYVEAPIYARTSGYVKAWYTDIGSRVRKGQTLASIETPEVDQQLRQAQADMATAQANLDLSLTTNERWQRLLATRSVSRQDADERAGDAAAKTAALASAKANVQRLRELEGFKRVVAPFAGVVTTRNTDVGSLINAGESMNAQLFTITDTRTLRIYAQVPEAFAAATTAGLKAELHFQEHPGESFPVDTVRTSQALDPSGRTLQVELLLDNSAGRFFPGAYTEIHFHLRARKQALRVPSNAILFRAAGLQIATVADGKIKLKTIKQGRDFGKTIEVLDGIGPNDEVIVNPPDSAADDTPVRIAQKPPAPTQSAPDK